MQGEGSRSPGIDNDGGDVDIGGRLPPALAPDGEVCPQSGVAGGGVPVVGDTPDPHPPQLGWSQPPLLALTNWPFCMAPPQSATLVGQPIGHIFPSITSLALLWCGCFLFSKGHPTSPPCGAGLILQWHPLGMELPGDFLSTVPRIRTSIGWQSIVSWQSIASWMSIIGCENGSFSLCTLPGSLLLPGPADGHPL